MRKIVLVIHPGHWELIPRNGIQMGYEENKGWYKSYKSAKTANKEYRFLCFSLILEKDVKETEYIKKWEDREKEIDGTS